MKKQKDPESTMMTEEGREFNLNTVEQLLRFECCNCGLTHDFEFRVKDKKKIGIIIKATIE